MAEERNGVQFNAPHVPTGPRAMKSPSANPLPVSFPSAMHRHSTTLTRLDTAMPNTNPLPDVDAALNIRRINEDLREIFKRPCPPDTRPTIKGIGLFSHVEGSATIPKFPHERCLQAEPQFLPVGGVRRLGRETGREVQTSEAVRGVWNKVRDAMEVEEKVTGTSEMTVEELRKRFGALPVPEESVHLQLEAQVRQLQLGEQDAAMQDDIAGQQVSTTPVTPGSGGRRASWGGPVQGLGGAGDVARGRTGPERRSSTARTRTIYNRDLDPREHRP